MSNDLGNDSPDKKTPDVNVTDGGSLEDMKTSIKVIEGLFHAIDKASFPLKCYGDVMNGMTFLKAVHNSLVTQIGPDEVARIRAQAANPGNIPTPTGMVQ